MQGIDAVQLWGIWYGYEVCLFVIQIRACFDWYTACSTNPWGYSIFFVWYGGWTGGRIDEEGRVDEGEDGWIFHPLSYMFGKIWKGGYRTLNLTLGSAIQHGCMNSKAIS